MREDELLERLVALNLPVGPISRALRIAREVHAEQRRDDGSFYLEEHITVWPTRWRATRKCSGQADSLTSTLVAILHDSMEDSDDPSGVRVWIEGELGDDVAHFVERLTKPQKSEFAHLPAAEARAARETAYMDGVQQLPAHTRLVKVIDRINNLLCVHKSPGKIGGYVQGTIRHHLPLAATVDTELVEQMAFIIEALQRRLEIDDVAAPGA